MLIINFMRSNNNLKYIAAKIIIIYNYYNCFFSLSVNVLGNNVTRTQIMYKE